MTFEESARFITVLKDYHKDWQPSDTEVTAWSKRLKNIDYQQAKTSLEEFMFRNPRRGKFPENGRILDWLRLYASIPKQDDKFVPEPGVLYGQLAFENFFVNTINGEPSKMKELCETYIEQHKGGGDPLIPWTKFFRWLANRAFTPVPKSEIDKHKQKLMVLNHLTPQRSKNGNKENSKRI